MIEVTEVVQNITVDETNYTIDIQLAGTQGEASDHLLLQNIGTLSHDQLESAIENRVPYVGAGADINLGNTQKITNCQDPSSDQDVATKIYVDSLAASKEGSIVTGLTSQYWRGDKTWQPITSITSNLVPYSGATSNVNLGTRTLDAWSLYANNNVYSNFLRLRDSVFFGNAGEMYLSNGQYSFLDSQGNQANVRVGDIDCFHVGAYTLMTSALKTGTISNLSDQLLIDVDARQIKLSGGDVAIDIDSTSLMNYGVQIYNWTTGLFYNGVGYTLDVMGKNLLDPASAQAVLQWTDGVKTYDNTGIPSGDFSQGGSGSRCLFDFSGLYSVRFGDRQLYTSGGMLAVDYQNGILNDTLDGFNSIAWTDRYLVYNSTVVLDWASLLVNDYSTIASIKWGNRQLCNTSGQSQVDWATSQQLKLIGSLMVGPSFMSPTAKLHIDSGNATASYLKFTAGTTTGQTATDGFDIGITTAGVAEIRQREAQALNFFTNNTNYMSLASNAPTLTLDSQGSNSSNAGTIIFRTAGGSESFTQAFDASANVFTFTYGTSAALRIDSTSKVLVKQGGTTSLLGAMTTLNSQVTTVGNTTTTETTLHTVSTASSTWNGNGESVEVIAAGSFAANANGKQLKLKLGAVTLFDSGSLVINGGSWKITSRIFRVSTTTGKVITTLTTSNGSPTILTSYVSFTSFNFLTINSLLVTGQATATNDIVGELFQAFWIPVA